MTTPCYYCEMDRTCCKACIHGEADVYEILNLTKEKEQLKDEIIDLKEHRKILKKYIKNAAKSLSDNDINPNLDTVWYSKWETMYDYLMFISGGEIDAP